MSSLKRSRSTIATARVGLAALELRGEPLVEQATVREPGQLVGQRQLAGGVQRGVLVERQRHPDEHQRERRRRQEDGGVDRLVEVVGDQQSAGDDARAATA